VAVETETLTLRSPPSLLSLGTASKVGVGGAASQHQWMRLQPAEMNNSQSSPPILVENCSLFMKINFNMHFIFAVYTAKFMTVSMRAARKMGKRWQSSDRIRKQLKGCLACVEM
jgi:hypothetical protein